MKQFIFFQILIFATVVSAKGKNTVCESCTKAIALEKKIADSKIVPDQMNAKTIPQQDEYVSKSTDAIQTLLKQRPFKVEHARALLKLLSRIACFYDNQGDIASINRDAFRSIYGLKDNVLKKELDLMVKSGEITEKRSKAILESIGAIPANDYFQAGCTDYK